MIPLETFPLVEWHYGELADVPSFAVLKTQICVTPRQCVNAYNKPDTTAEIRHLPRAMQSSSGIKNSGKFSDKANNRERYLFLATYKKCEIF